MVLSLVVSATDTVFAIKAMTARPADHVVMLLRFVVVQWLLRLGVASSPTPASYKGLYRRIWLDSSLIA